LHEFFTLGVAVLLEGVPYLILTVLSARQFFREPGSSRLHTFLIFATITVSLLLTEAGAHMLAVAPGEQVTTLLLDLSPVSGLCVLYVVFLFAANLTHLPYSLAWLVTTLFLAGTALMLIAFPSGGFSDNPALAAQLSFLGPFALLALFVSYLLLAIYVWYTSGAAAGARRYRLQWISIGLALIVGSCALVALGSLLPLDDDDLIWAQGLLLLLAGMLLYCGSNLPVWLRYLWVLPELERISQLSSALLLNSDQRDTSASEEGTRTILCQMLQSAVNGLGARVGIVQLWNEQTGALEVAASIAPPEESFAAHIKSAGNEVLLEAFNNRRALLSPITRRKCPFTQRDLMAGTLLVVPLLASEQTLGVMGLCCEQAASFTQRDLAMLQLFADQMTRWLLHHSRQQKATTLEAMRHEQKLKNEFIALIAHDLRTPLTVLRGRMQFLQRQLMKEGQTAVAEAMSVLDAPYSRLSQLTTTLLDVSYLDAGRLQLALHVVDLVGLVRKVVEKYSQGRRIVLETVSPATKQTGEEMANAPPMVVMADSGRLKQVLSNLLDNACKYSPVESSITVRVEWRAGANEARVCVRDAGIGIPLADQPHLFQRWFRATNSSSQHYGGVGLGLYISHEVITLHGGKLWVESTGVPGEGATFSFTLPLLSPEQIGGSAEPQAEG
jgi:signal transduction histidine kinase